jgi:hypothetical protein
MSLLKGALVEFAPTFLVPLPNVILFQYNPESMTHTWSQPQPAPQPGQTAGDPTAVKGLPGEEFSFSIALDAADDISRGDAVNAGLAKIVGVYARLAALELLLYPAKSGGGDLLGTVSALAAAAGAGKKAKTKVPKLNVPVVLFIWGAGRIVPVVVKALTITEKLHDPRLNPTHVEATLVLRVLTPEEIAAEKGQDTLAGLARTAYDYTLTLRQGLALANLAGSAASALGMLPL